MQLRFVADDGNVLRCRTESKIAEDTFTPGRDELAEMFGSDVYHRRIVIDLASSSMINSSGIGTLVHLHRLFDEGGGRLVLHYATPLVEKTLKVLNLYQVFHMACDEDEACRVAEEESA